MKPLQILPYAVIFLLVAILANVLLYQSQQREVSIEDTYDAPTAISAPVSPAPAKPVQPVQTVTPTPTYQSAPAPAPTTTRTQSAPPDYSNPYMYGTSEPIRPNTDYDTGYVNCDTTSNGYSYNTMCY